MTTLENHIRKALIYLLLFAAAGFVSCDSIRDDLSDCRLLVRFKYDYNMTSVDAFAEAVDKVELYVFDRAGKFLFSQTEEGDALAAVDERGNASYLMAVALPPGEYRFMAWAGAHDSYRIADMVPGVTDITEMSLKLKRPASLIVDKQLEPLWYGEILDVHYTGGGNRIQTVNLIRNTNRVRFGFQSVSQNWGIRLEDYRFEIVESNGYLDYQNALLPDDILSYRPYREEQKSDQAVVVELNTLRLLDDPNHKTRFIVTEKASGTQVFNISLTEYFEMTLSPGWGWGVQEYFDRQWEWNIVFFLSDSWLATQININDWTWYRQPEEI